MSLALADSSSTGPVALSRGTLAVILVLALALHLALVALVFWASPRDGTVAEGQGGLTIGLGPAGVAPGALDAVEADSLDAATPDTLPPVEATAEATVPVSSAPAPDVSPALTAAAAPATVAPQPGPVPVVTQAPQAISTPTPQPETAQSPIMAQSLPPGSAISDAITATAPQDGLGVSRRPVKRPSAVEDAGRKAAEANAAVERERQQRRSAETQSATASPSPRRGAASGQQGQSGSSQGSTRGSGDDTRGGGNPGARADFAALVAARLARAKQYPRAAQQRRLQGTGVVWFRINAAGTVTASRLTRSTGHTILDQEIMQTLRRARLPSIPTILNQTQLEFSVPMAFSLR